VIRRLAVRLLSRLAQEGPPDMSRLDVLDRPRWVNGDRVRDARSGRVWLREDGIWHAEGMRWKFTDGDVDMCLVLGQAEPVVDVGVRA
jgi:hypothetical protein